MQALDLPRRARPDVQKKTAHAAEHASLSQARSRELLSPCPKPDIPDFRLGSRVRVSLAQLCGVMLRFPRGGELQVVGNAKGGLSAEPARQAVPSFKHLEGPGSA
jgi:hypothetical protein